MSLYIDHPNGSINMRIGINSTLLLAVASSVTAGILALVLYTSSSTYGISSDIQEAALLQSANSTAAFLTHYIAQAKEIIADFSTLPAMTDALAGNPDKADAQLKTFVTNSDMFATLMLLDPSGKPVAGHNKSNEALASSYADREYYKAIASGQDSYVTRRILKGKSTGVTMFVVSKAIRGANGKLLGVLVGCPAWETFTKAFIDPLKFGATGYAFIIDDEGLIIAHGANKSLILNPDVDKSVSNKALGVKNGLTHYVFGGAEKFMAVAQIPSTGWVVCMAAAESEMNATAVRQRNILLLLGAVVLVAVVTIITLFNRRVVLRPLAAIGAFTEKVAAGDLKAQLAGTFRFELKALADNICDMVAELKNKLAFSEGVLRGIPAPCAILDPDHKMTWVNRQACDILERKGSPEDQKGLTSGEFFFNDKSRATLSDRAITEKKPVNATIEFITPSKMTRHFDITATPFFDLDGVLLGSFTFWTDLTDIMAQQKRIEEQNSVIAHTAAEASAVADRMASAAQELSSQIEQSANGADIQRQRIQETATAVEEMNATILEVAQNSSKTADSAENARTKADEGATLVGEVVAAVLSVRDEAEGLKEDMRGLGDKAQGIGTVLGVISDIADQTNLLALNAAIEAARAGEAGRGFAVVADEVRKLAEKTMTATKEVGQAITGIQQGTRETVARVEKAVEAVGRAAGLAERSGGTLSEIVTLVEAAGDQVRSIATASEQQSATSEEINRAVEEVNRLSGETADAMAQSNQAVAELAELAQRLNTLIGELESGGTGPKALT
jgi:methyl-accepting chemotaxis protein